MKLKKLISSLTVAALIGSLTTSIAFAENKSKPSLVSLGDSVTYGLYLGNTHHPSKDAFPYIMGAAEKYRVRDLAESGWTTVDLMNALTHSKFKEAVRHADVVTLDIGNNDLLQAAREFLADPQHNPLDQEKIGQAIMQIGMNIPQIIGQIRELNPSAPIIVYNLYNPFPAPLSAIVEPAISGANQAISLVTLDPTDNIVLADAHAAFAAAEDLSELVRLADGDIHPTEKGQELLAEIGIEAIDSLEQ